MAKILAVEDEALVRILIVETLTDAGHDVLEAADGEAALAIVGENPDIELIVTDIRMAKMDGFTLAVAARAIRPDVRVLFMTGYMGTDIPAKIPDAKVLQKPFDPDELLVAIQSMLAGRGKPA
jgi:CheY-like chemotaxis protein